jgi:hypothetical protein
MKAALPLDTPPVGVLFHSVSLHFGYPKPAILLAFLAIWRKSGPHCKPESIAQFRLSPYVHGSYPCFEKNTTGKDGHR